MAKLPTRRKVTVVCYRRAGPDEVLVVPREAKGAPRLVLPSVEHANEPARDAALALVAGLVRGAPLADAVVGGVTGTYRVGGGPSAGEWTEVFHAVEVARDARLIAGRWLTHYDAKAQAGADAPRAREAITRVRAEAKLLP